LLSGTLQGFASWRGGAQLADFAECLLEVGRNEFGPGASTAQILDFCKKLHLKDLALAQACSRGSTIAWEWFLDRYRDRLYAAALVLARDESVACELADSISGDLFCCADNAKLQASKLASYTGRGSLDGWLKAVLTHAYVDRYRSSRRMVSLDRHLDSLKSCCLRETAEHTAADARLDDAVKEAFLQCDPEKRFLLATYFFDNRTLVEIAAAWESRIDCQQRRQIEELFQSDVCSLSLDVRRHLFPDIDLVRE
jgi:RNA polymerase sigma-70 factor (ECF subfamily)